MATKKKDPRAATSRTRGAVGKNPLVYQAFRRLFTPGMVAGNLKVLDFGAGKEAVHTFKLRQEGYQSVFAYDLPDNMPTDFVAGWTAKPLAHSWDVVLLSNVLNVQESREDVVGLLKKIKRLMCRPHGVLILNFPENPRKSPVTTKELEVMLVDMFNPIVSRVGGTAQAPCFYITILETA